MFLTGPRWSKVARRNSLRPGQLLLFDNAAVVHGSAQSAATARTLANAAWTTGGVVHVARFVAN